MTDTPWEADKLSEDVDALFFDLEGDGDLDLYVVSGGNEFEAGNSNYQDRLYINVGENLKRRKACYHQWLSAAQKWSPQIMTMTVTLTFCGWQINTSCLSYAWQSFLLNNNGGKFSDVTGTAIPGLSDLGMVTDAVWTDFDLNGTTDLIVVGEWMPITLFKKYWKGFQKYNRRNRF